MIHNGFRVDNPLLNQYDPVVSNVLLKVYVRAGNHQIVGPILSLVVDGEAMILQICPAASRGFVACDRELGQPESSKHLVKAVAVERREGMRVVGKVLGNLVHLGCLIHRTADEEDPFSHSLPPQSLLKVSNNKVNKMARGFHPRYSGKIRNDVVVLAARFSNMYHFALENTDPVGGSEKGGPAVKCPSAQPATWVVPQLKM